MRIFIVGAGFAGLSSAKVLKAFGHEVTVFEKESDVGGVWSASRRYPGLTTQNVRSTYCLSDFPYPKDYPEWPSGEQVQKYLANYAKHFQLDPLIQLNTEVTDAQLNREGTGWIIKVRRVAASSLPLGQEVQSLACDYLIVGNGIFSDPLVPKFEGAEDFVAAGGKICHTSEFGDHELARDKNVLIVGYGKSSCDVAQAISAQASSTTVVARHLIWKVPKLLMNALNYKFLLLTRMGEALFKYIHLKGIERFLHGVGKPIRNSMLGQVQWVITKQCKLKQLGLVPPLPFESIARSTVSLVTDGFFESVAAGRIKIAKNTEIARLFLRDNHRFAELASGEIVPADLIVCGTGWNQRVPFFSSQLMSKITDVQGNFRLYRSMVPVGVPHLAFNGYNSSFFSQLNCEIGALWIADLIGGGLKLPTVAEQEKTITERLAWMEERTDGKHSKGTNIIPFSLHHIDELLVDLKLTLGVFTRIKQWLMPVEPADYFSATRLLLARHKAK